MLKEEEKGKVGKEEGKGEKGIEGLKQEWDDGRKVKIKLKKLKLIFNLNIKIRHFVSNS